MKPGLVLFALVALCIADTAGTHATAAETGAVESLLGLHVDARGVVFQVFSGGCTTQADFRLARFQSAPVQLLLIRLHPDRCEAFVPYGTRLRYSYERLGLEQGQRFVVVNPLAPVQVVKRGEDTIALAATPEEIDVEVGDVVTVVVQVVNRVSGRTYAFTISEQPTSGQIDADSVETDSSEGIMSFRFEATTPTGFTTDTIGITVTDSAGEEGSLDIAVSVRAAH
jgi:hypothetical protein